MDWLVIIVAIIAAVLIGIILYRIDKNNNKKSKDEEIERK